MPVAAYYNEIDPYAAQWLCNLIAAGHIASGDVDERSIEDVHPDDLRPYTQCHFFAGLGGWSLALRRAGWPDHRPVWTGSCPCQPYSQAGQGLGFDDPRHLWPHFAWLIRQRRPGEILGEQVASKDAEPWLDLVQADLEGMAYAFGAVAFPSAGIGSPHIRDRTYWVANANFNGLATSPGGRLHHQEHHPQSRGSARRLGHSDSERVRGNRRTVSGAQEPARREVWRQPDSVEPAGTVGCLANTECGDTAKPQGQRSRPGDAEGAGAPDQSEGCSALLDPRPAGPVNGLWATADWLFCRDGKWRPVEPGTFPLAHGAPARVGRLRAYGNAINVEAAAQFITAYMEVGGGGPPPPRRGGWKTARRHGPLTA
ncbi:DNA cytosine methyltransferase, partial [Pseudomonas nitroreducens]